MSIAKRSNKVALLLLTSIWVPFLLTGSKELIFAGGVVALGSVYLSFAIPKLLRALGVRSRIIDWLLDLDSPVQSRKDQ